jgi:hypothetical protein
MMMQPIKPECIIKKKKDRREKKILRNSNGEDYQLRIGRQIYDGVQMRVQRSDCRDERYK